MTTSEILRYVSYACFGLALVSAVIAVVTFFRRDILSTIAELRGETARKEIAALQKRDTRAVEKPKTHTRDTGSTETAESMKIRSVKAQTGEFTSSGALDGKGKKSGRLTRTGRLGKGTAAPEKVKPIAADPISIAEAEEATAMLTEDEEIFTAEAEDAAAFSEEEATALLDEEEEEATALLDEDEEEATALLDEDEEEATALLDEEEEEATALLDEDEEEATALLEEPSFVPEGHGTSAPQGFEIQDREIHTGTGKH